jgi:hypothetical protein
MLEKKVEDIIHQYIRLVNSSDLIENKKPVYNQPFGWDWSNSQPLVTDGVVMELRKEMPDLIQGYIELHERNERVGPMPATPEGWTRDHRHEEFYQQAEDGNYVILTRNWEGQWAALVTDASGVVPDLTGQFTDFETALEQGTELCERPSSTFKR